MSSMLKYESTANKSLLQQKLIFKQQFKRITNQHTKLSKIISNLYGDYSLMQVRFDFPHLYKSTDVQTDLLEIMTQINNNQNELKKIEHSLTLIQNKIDELNQIVDY